MDYLERGAPPIGEIEILYLGEFDAIFLEKLHDMIGRTRWELLIENSTVKIFEVLFFFSDITTYPLKFSSTAANSPRNLQYNSAMDTAQLDFSGVFGTVACEFYV